MPTKHLFLVLLVLGVLQPAAADSIEKVVAMTDRGASTFYVDARAGELEAAQFLVDTGSSYTTINRDTLERLLAADQAAYVKDLRGVLADGSSQVVPLYVIRSLTIGESCVLHDVRAAVFPDRSRNILGLSALRQASPFVFSTDPPTLELSNCEPPHAGVASRDAPENEDAG